MPAFSGIFAICSLRADQVVMQNGDVLNGAVLSANTNLVILRDDNLGDVALPRGEVSTITFGTPATTKPPLAPAANAPLSAGSPTNTDLSEALRDLRNDTNLVQQVQSQILGSAGPDATKQFNDLLDGLSTGKIDMNGLRQQAQSEADQLRSMKKDLGDEDSGEIDSYLAILNDFLQETSPSNSASNSPPPPTQPTDAPAASSTP
ncbi:MAG: hypothetical protein ACLQSR_17095 [Limisphaerales bacterium]